MSPRLPLPDLGAYLREQRMSAEMTLRQVADLAGISNPYLSQIERGLKRPSAEILQKLSSALQISAETLYIRAGILEAQSGGEKPTVLEAIEADEALTSRQRAALTDIYTSFIAANATTEGVDVTPEKVADASEPDAKPAPKPKRSSRSATGKTTATRSAEPAVKTPAATTRRKTARTSKEN